METGKEKKENVCLKKEKRGGEKLFVCSLVNKLSVSYSTFPSPETSPPPHPFYPGSNLLLMHPRRHVDRQEIPQIRPANFCSTHTHKHTHTASEW